jgi:hypothetical protein
MGNAMEKNSSKLILAAYLLTPNISIHQQWKMGYP